MIEIIENIDDVLKIKQQEKLIYDFYIELPGQVFLKKYNYYHIYTYEFFSQDLFLKQFKDLDIDFIISGGIKKNEISQNNKIIGDSSTVKVKFNSKQDQSMPISISDDERYHWLEFLSDKIYIYSISSPVAIYCDRYYNVSIIASGFDFDFKHSIPEKVIINNLKNVLDFEIFLCNYRW